MPTWPLALVGLSLFGLAMSGQGALAADSTPPLMTTPGTFGVTPMGAATYSIPIIVPPGTAGLVPALSVDYSSQNANSTLGLGWVLGGLSSITRCPRTIAQDGVHGSVNYDANDRYCMEGQRLVMISGSSYGADGSVYRTEIDTFAEIIAHGSAGNGPSWFEVHTKSGLILDFGITTDSQVPTVNATTGAIGPTASSWLVHSISDTRGNNMIVSYVNDTANGQAYPSEIVYGANSNVSGSTAYNSVQFVYTTRTDIVPYYQAGMLQQITMLMTDIKTYAGSSMVFDYELGYQTAAQAAIAAGLGSSSAGAFHDELRTVTQCDNGTPQKCLPQVSIGWQGGTGLPPMTTTEETSPSVQGGPNFIYSGDVNADGITDLISSCTNPAIYAGTGGGNFTPSTLQLTLSGPECPGGNSTASLAMADLDGEGYSGYFFSSTILSGIYSGANDNQNGTAFTNVAIFGAPSNYGFPNIADFNGDGRQDYFQFTSITGGGGTDNYYVEAVTGTAQIFLNNGAGSSPRFSGSTTFSWPSLTSNAVMQAFMVTGDFDGDGCTDLLTQGPGAGSVINFSCNPAVSSATIPFWLSQFDSPYYTQFVVGDFNGDGKSDVLVLVPDVGANPISCAFVGMFESTGTGLVQTNFTVPNDWCKYRVHAGDFNGDGKTDIALVPPGILSFYGPGQPISIWLSTGSGFVKAASIANQDTCSAPSPIYPFPFCEDGYVADWDSTGAAALWLAPSSWNSQQGCCDFLYSFAYKPELVTSVSNGIGATTTIGYTALNANGSFYTKGTSETYPTQDVDGAIYVVSLVTRSNGIGGTQATSYTYADAQKDLSGRGFLGFAQITQSTPTESYISPSNTNVTNATIVQTTIYGQANSSCVPNANGLDFPFTGMVACQTKVEQWSGGSVTLSTTQNNFDEQSLPVGADGVKRYFMAIALSTVTGNDLNGSMLPTVKTSHAFDCDTNPTNTCYGDEVETIITRADGSTSTTNNTFTDDATDWLLGRVISSSIDNIVGSSSITRNKSSCYDLPYVPAGTSCPAEGKSGLLLSETIEPGASDVTQISMTNYTYDTYGNKTKVAVTACVYASGTCTNTTRNTNNTYTLNGQFLATTTNDLLESESWTFSSSFGVPTQHVGPNGVVTNWTQDTFGRPSTEMTYSPSLSTSAPTGTVTTFAYCSGVDGGSATCPTYGAYETQVQPSYFTGTSFQTANQDGPIAISYRDQLSRTIGSQTQGFDGSGTAPLIDATTQYNQFGHIYETSRPYFAGNTPAYTVNTTIDALGRPITVNYPDTGQVGYVYNALIVTKTETIQNPVTGSPTTEQTTTTKNDEGMVAIVNDALGHNTNYAYDAFNNLLTTTDTTGSNVVTNTYDTIGRKLSSKDPDLGLWSYTYDGFSELNTQTDAKSQVTTMSYDVLGRLASRAEPDMTSTWTYGIGGPTGPTYPNNQATYPNSIDKLVVSACTDNGSSTVCPGSNYHRTYSYDPLGRQTGLTIAFSTASYYTTTAYDPNTGRVTNARNFSSFETTNLYTNLGYLLKVVDYTSGFVYWQATARDAELHLLQDTQGAAMYETRSFDPNSGRVSNICAALETTTCSGDVAKFAYSWDTASNLAQRQGAFNSSTQAYTQTEDFCYDQLNRLTNSALAVSGASLSSCTSSGTNIIDNSVTYDEIGDILTKSDVGTYTYPSAGSAQPHGVASINTTTGCMLTSCTVAGASNPIYEYDANGNVTCASVGAACTGAKIRTFTYTAANMTEKAKEGTAYTYSFTYNPEHERSEMSDQSGDQTYYLNDPASNVMNERYSSGGVVTWRSYIVADGKIVELHSVTSSTTTMSYFVLDHLGSVATIYAPSTSTPITAQSYDAWGKMRNPTSGLGDPSCALPPASPTTRGFTNQEQMTQQCLDNYNARIYDPQIGRFMAADTVIPDSYNGQSYNRYTYVENGPLSYDDPTGHIGGPGFIWAAAAASGDEFDFWNDLNSGTETLGAAEANAFANAVQEASSAQGTSPAGLTTHVIYLQDVVVIYKTDSTTDYSKPIPGYAIVDKSDEVGQQLINANASGAVIKFDASAGVLSWMGAPNDGGTLGNANQTGTRLGQNKDTKPDATRSGCNEYCSDGSTPRRAVSMLGTIFSTSLTYADMVAEIVSNQTDFWRAGQSGEQMAANELIKEGYNIVGAQVYVRTALGLRITDFLVTGGNLSPGNFGGVEVKVNDSQRSRLQMLKDQILFEQGGTVVSRDSPYYGMTLRYDTGVYRILSRPGP